MKTLLNHDKLNLKGKFIVYGVNGRRNFELDLKENGSAEFAKLKAKEPTQTGRGQGCIDWFMVTTVTYVDGSTSTSSQYVTTTCSGGGCSDPNMASVCPEGDGRSSGGGGGGYGVDYEFEYLYHKGVNWVVGAPASGHYVVYSFETISGKKVSGVKSITGIVHNRSAGFSDGYAGSAAWTQLQAVVNFTSSQAAASVSGKVHFADATHPLDVPLSNNKQWTPPQIVP
ncbi:hypothetical protein GCM10023184_23430 [Flaviaesturariibacter amylovorans]|uniref:Uncharacterized protein n=2 Tax=Flaviaesturariibacter amylovorans TaxID=1084520 RepID=A0ABP8GXQ3_9BACT